MAEPHVRDKAAARVLPYTIPEEIPVLIQRQDTAPSMQGAQAGTVAYGGAATGEAATPSEPIGNAGDTRADRRPHRAHARQHDARARRGC
jgi:hypothetical protein